MNNATVVQRLDNTIHWTSRFPLYDLVGFGTYLIDNVYLLDSTFHRINQYSLDNIREVVLIDLIVIHPPVTTFELLTAMNIANL